MTRSRPARAFGLLLAREGVMATLRRPQGAVGAYDPATGDVAPAAPPVDVLVPVLPLQLKTRMVAGVLRNARKVHVPAELSPDLNPNPRWGVLPWTGFIAITPQDGDFLALPDGQGVVLATTPVVWREERLFTTVYLDG